MRVYYNEWDSKAAAWLRELIRMGLLPDGEVDERSILEVDEVDLWGFGQHHFFAGIGGWPLALRMSGLEGVEGIMTGSPPCQPFSLAGKLKGKSDERHLAPKFIELVRAVRPRVLFGEQVASAAVFGKAAGSARKRAGTEPAWAWFDDLSDRLEAAHYAVGTSDIPAAGVGAPHIRQRTFFGAVAIERVDDATGTRCDAAGFRPKDETWHEARLCGSERGRTGDRLADTSQKHHNWVRDSGTRWWSKYPDSGIGGGLADSIEPKLEGYSGDGDRSGEPGRVEAGSDGPIASKGGTSWVDDTGRSSSTDGPWGDVDWLFCRGGKWRPAQSASLTMADGVPTRVVQGRNLFHPLTENEEARTPRLKGYGNAIVPQVAAVFVESFMESLWWVR